MTTKLELAISQIKSGNIKDGKKLLLEVLDENPREEKAWLWMYQCVSTPDQKAECLRRALEINPSNQAARAALEKISSPQITTAHSNTLINNKPLQTASIGDNAVAQSKKTEPNIQPKKSLSIPKASTQTPQKSTKRPAPKKSSRLGSWIPVFVALIACCGTVIAAFLGSDYIMALLPGQNEQGELTFSVRVADASGSAISNAKVIFFYPTGSLSQYTDSSGTSTFNVSKIGKGNLRVIVESENYQIYEEQLDSSNETTIDVRLAEKQGSKENIILRAVKDGTTEPISGIEFIVVVDGGIYQQLTDSDGFAMLQIPFPSDGLVDAQISVNATGYGIENQFTTLSPGKLQYVLLSPNSLRVEIPNIPNAPQSSALPTKDNQPDALGEVIGSGVEIYQESGDSGLKIIMLTADSKPWEDAYFEVYEQKIDVAGNPSQGDRIKYGSINLQGELIFEIEPGTYSVCPPELGYGWTSLGCIYNVQIVSGSQTVVKVQSGKLEFVIIRADGTPSEDVYAEIYTQQDNASGQPVTDDRVWYGNTDNTGTFIKNLAPGNYSLVIDLRGYNWGNLADRYGQADISINKGTTTTIVVKMGRLSFGITDASGLPANNVYLEVYTQKKDVNGNPALDQRIWYGNTDESGVVTVSLTQGQYAVKINNQILYDVPLEWGVITQTDGLTYSQNK
ncbi:hypothetical protein MASR2M66_11080 [Chloroflexota bacterium]